MLGICAAKPGGGAVVVLGCNGGRARLRSARLHQLPQKTQPPSTGCCERRSEKGLLLPFPLGRRLAAVRRKGVGAQLSEALWRDARVVALSQQETERSDFLCGRTRRPPAQLCSRLEVESCVHSRYSRKHSQVSQLLSASLVESFDRRRSGLLSSLAGVRRGFRRGAAGTADASGCACKQVQLSVGPRSKTQSPRQAVAFPQPQSDRLLSRSSRDRAPQIPAVSRCRCQEVDAAVFFGP